MTKACVLLKCQSGSEDHIISNLRSLGSVRHAVGVLGTYDIVTSLSTDSEEKLRDVIIKEFRKIPKVTGTYTLIVDNGKGFDKTIEGKEYLDRYLSQAYVLIDCAPNKESHIISELRQVPEVLDADVFVSSHEIMCSVMAPTYDSISGIVTKKIRRIPYISGTTTLNVIGK